MVVNRGVFVGMSNNPASLDFGEQEKCVNKTGQDIGCV